MPHILPIILPIFFTLAGAYSVVAIIGTVNRCYSEFSRIRQQLKEIQRRKD